MNETVAIINMTGPEFLVLYAIVNAVTLAGCWLWLRLRDPFKDVPLPPFPSRPIHSRWRACGW